MNNELEIDEVGNKFWYKDDLLHREDGPAVEYTNGDKCWYRNGLRHRENGPAVDANRTKCWYRDGEPYREDNLPHYEGMGGDKRWFYKDKWYKNFEEYVLAKVVG